jgi:hypothetical protein
MLKSDSDTARRLVGDARGDALGDGSCVRRT